MNDAQFEKLMETSWQRPLTPDEETRLNAWLLGHPERQALWDEESGLSALLRHLPDAPPVSSNFTARVMAAVEREGSRSGVPGPARRARPWRAWMPRWAGAFLVAIVAFIGVRHLKEGAAEPLLEEVRMVGVIADIPNAETLRDFEAIQELPLPSLVDKVDMELLAALE